MVVLLWELMIQHCNSFHKASPSSFYKDKITIKKIPAENWTFIWQSCWTGFEMNHAGNIFCWLETDGTFNFNRWCVLGANVYWISKPKLVFVAKSSAASADNACKFLPSVVLFLFQNTHYILILIVKIIT